MKNITLSLTLIVTLLSFTASPTSGICKDNQPADALSKLQNGTVWTGASVGPGLQKAWTDHLKTGDDSRKVQCSIVLRNPATDADKAALISSGFTVKSLAGTMGRGHMYIKDLPRVAGNPVIKSIKLTTE